MCFSLFKGKKKSPKKKRSYGNRYRDGQHQGASRNEFVDLNDTDTWYKQSDWGSAGDSCSPVSDSGSCDSSSCSCDCGE